MIDAYEIGIQLALQDDVSAGLQVISQGLQEVDRAIDATSAKLVQLTHEAQTKVSGSTAGVSMRPAAAAIKDVEERAAEPVVETKRSIGAEGPVAALPSAVSEPSEPTSIALSGAQRSVAPVELGGEPTPAASPFKDSLMALDSEAPRERSSAPTLVQIQHSMEAVTSESPRPPAAEPKLAHFTGGLRAASPVPSPSVSRSASAVPSGSDRQERVKDLFVTSSLERSVAPAQAERIGPLTSSTMSPGMYVVDRAERTAAPWSGVEAKTLSPRPAPAFERTAAPQPRQQDRSEGMSGTVMLDGHLVGQWLAEQMAKEASRPPSGTSFFDPRQTPAWSASGSL